MFQALKKTLLHNIEKKKGEKMFLFPSVDPSKTV